MENFIKTFIKEDLENKRYAKIITRFPPEPNGYLHIGHARAIITDFELAKDFHGDTNLRYDDTNPSKEDKIYVDNILKDIKWLGYNPKNVFFASNYFDYMYEKALLLIHKGLAYVDHQSAEEISKTRGNLTQPGTPSVYRNRSIKENLDLFAKMTSGFYNEGDCVLRAKIDMASPNINLRDPAIYRIIKKEHHNTGWKWVVYPMYDFAHPLEDAYEGISHSLCSLEFEDHRPLYEWVINNCETIAQPRQIEFGRLSIENTIMSKRYLLELVNSKKVSGWDDPRLPTLAGMRRRGYTPQSIKKFILSTGLSKINSIVPQAQLYSCLRDDLVLKAPRLMAVTKPLKVTITNYSKTELESYEVPINQDNLKLGNKLVYFGPTIYIESEDFSEIKPDKKFKRLSLNNEVRLLGIGYFIRAHSVIKNEEGQVVEVLATYDPLTKSGLNFNDRKPDGTISFLCADKMRRAEFRIYDDLLDPTIESDNILAKFNVNSLLVYQGFIEESTKQYRIHNKYQIIRNGYYSVDDDSKPSLIVLNNIVPLKSSYK
ncbi:MAG: glutamine--tRNA ligase [Acholeplasmatales bacterium]|jgi:glutaminyl-tRNA synthetase|nr:glutamine--tRNA ligase [Acholeplasmatales bacterium]